MLRQVEVVIKRFNLHNPIPSDKLPKFDNNLINATELLHLESEKMYHNAVKNQTLYRSVDCKKGPSK